MNTLLRKRNVIVIALGIIAACAVATPFILRRNPVAINTVNQVVPESNNAVAPQTDITQKKVGNEAGRVLSFENDKAYTADEINTYIQRFYTTSQEIPAKYDVKHYTVTFNTTDENDKLLAVTAQLYLPQVPDSEELPIFVHGSGTTGIDDKCAPSKEIFETDNWGDYNAQMLSFASQGYVVFFPDYEGFNDLNRVHHYFVAELEAKVLLDGARAVYDFFANNNMEVKPMQAVFFGGYSQGGHASFAVNDFARSYAPEVPIKGVVSYGGTMNIPSLLLNNPHLAPYLVVAYKDLYGDIVQPSEILQAQWAENVDTAAKDKCVSQAINDYPQVATQMYTSDFLDALQNNFDSDFQELKPILEKNNTGYKKGAAPILILQGSADTILPQETAEEYIEASCEAGNQITYNLYQGVSHYQTRQVSFKDTLQWLDDRVEEKPLQNYCDNK